MSRHPVVVLTGAPPHIDRWHDLAATGEAIAGVLGERYPARVTTTAELAGLADAALIVVNAAGEFDPEVDSTDVIDALLAANRSGVPLLAVHSSTTAFSDDPRWADLVGGRWVLDRSWHPPHGRTTVTNSADAPFGTPGSAFEVLDERYTELELRPGNAVVATHSEGGVAHPLVWTRDSGGGCGRAAYSALGHDIRSFTSPGHRALLAEAADWLLASRR